jgi:GDSL/SGNH-like Acyl-Esterase family found in Pmr5 and Cas1p
MGRFQVSAVYMGLFLVFEGTSHNFLSITKLLDYHATKLMSEMDCQQNITEDALYHESTRTYKNPPSLRVQPKVSRLCTRGEIIDGSWYNVEQSGPPYIPKNEHLRCYPGEHYRLPIWKTYAWEPHETNCHFSQFNASDYCSLMHFGTVLIAGDSLSWEQYSSLGQLLGLRIHQSSQFVSKEKRQNHVQFGCHRQSRIVFRRDDLLSNLSAAINDHFPVVVVLNRGAHYQNDTAFSAGMHKIIEEIKEWKIECALLGFKCHLFWRTSVPGHPKCDTVNFTKPINDVDQMESWIANRSNYDSFTMKYHWYDYQHQNELALNLLRQGLGDDGFQVLDAYHLNVRRPDEHRAHQGDCLHNCYPGKMDVYNQLLLHYLRMERTPADIEQLALYFSRARGAHVARNATAQE